MSPLADAASGQAKTLPETLEEVLANLKSVGYRSYRAAQTRDGTALSFTTVLIKQSS